MPQHYTVGYHDTDLHKFEICEYATSAYDAIQHSKEDVPYLREHPHFIISLDLWNLVFPWGIRYET